MNITQLCKRYGLEHYGNLEDAWDAFGPSGIVLMQLWHAPNQRLREHPLPGAHLRVLCFERAQHERSGADAYQGRVWSLAAVENGAKAYAAMSVPPSRQRGAGAWAKYANLERVFPVLALEREPDGDVFAVLGLPVPASELGAPSLSRRGRPSLAAVAGATAGAARRAVSPGGRASTPSAH
ncbi:hypothetical protein [Massilia sp. DD77]|uniref:hypothetical protein n=1 Tax=Massilia sp. DD77 TaxID=3109349 RepID=UPI003000D5E7